MKIGFNKKYTSIALYAGLIIIFAIVCYEYLKEDRVGTITGNIWAIISPIVWGAILAYIISPVMNFFERKVFIPKECRIARKKAKEEAIAKRITSKNKLEKIMFEASEKVREKRRLEKLNNKKTKKATVFNKIKNLRQNKEKLHYGNRALSLICTYILLLAIVAAIFYVVIPQVYDSVMNLYTTVSKFITSLPTYIAHWCEKYEWFNTAYEAVREELNITNLTSYLQNLLGNYKSYIDVTVGFISNLVEQVKNGVLIVIFSVYFLIYKEFMGQQFNNVLTAIASPKVAGYVRHIFKEFDVRFGQYLQGQILDSFFVGLLSFIIYGICGIPYYQLIAVVVGITNIIPVFGPFIGAIPSAIIILIADPSKVVLFILLVLVMQQIDGNVIVPRILGTTVGMKPIWIIVAITIMGGLFGFVGMFFGVPVFAVIYTLISEAINKRLAVKLAKQVVEETKDVDFVKLLHEKDADFEIGDFEEASTD